MGVNIDDLLPHVENHKNMMNNLETTQFEEKIESIKSHLAILPILKERNSDGFEHCKLGLLELIKSL